MIEPLHDRGGRSEPAGGTTGPTQGPGAIREIPPTRSTRQPGAADDRPLRQFAMDAANLLNDRHCEDVCLLDVRGLSQVCDYVLIASGTSNRQMRSIAEELAKLGDEQTHGAFRTSSDTGATWIVVDFIDLVVHLFEPSTRAYYDLESLWSDGDVVGWQRDGEHLPRQRRRTPEPD